MWGGGAEGGKRQEAFSPKGNEAWVKEELCISTRGKMVGGNLGYNFWNF